MEQRLLAYADALPLAVPPLAAVLPKAVVLAHTSLSYAVGFANDALKQLNWRIGKWVRVVAW